MSAEYRPPTVDPAKYVVQRNPILDYLQSGDFTNGYALYEALADPRTRIGSAAISEAYADAELPPKTVKTARRWAGLQYLPTEEAIRIEERARRLADR